MKFEVFSLKFEGWGFGGLGFWAWVPGVEGLGLWMVMWPG